MVREKRNFPVRDVQVAFEDHFSGHEPRGLNKWSVAIPAESGMIGRQLIVSPAHRGYDR